MAHEDVTLTREALYEQVWKTPMSRLAAEFGISDVALAKICKKLDVPIPGRGYWARVTNGQRVKQPKLPKARASTRTEFTIAKRAPRDPDAPKERPQVPEVVVSDSLAGAHKVVKQLGSELEQKGLYLRGYHEAAFSVTKDTKRRTLLILDALLKALESRGHTSTFEVPEGSNWGHYKLSVMIGEEPIELSVMEPSITKFLPHDPNNFLDRIRGPSEPRRDLVPSGRLRLRARGGYSATRSWSDGASQRVEDVLGRAVVGLEALSQRVRADRLRREEEERQRQAEERRRQTRMVLRNYERALGRELERAVEDLRRANAVRELVRATADAAVPEAKADAVAAWVAWAAAWADRLDPRSDPLRAARVVKPDVSAMTEAEFKYWCEWPESAKRAGTGYGPSFEPRDV